MKSLSKIILFVAALVSLLLVVGIYALFSGFGERMMQHAAFARSEVAARLTFSNMFQLMTQGWKREQVLAFTRSATDSLAGSPLRIQFHRGEPVGRDYGAAAAQGAPDQAVTEALRTGRSAEVLTPTGARFVYALKAEESCLRCHAKAAKGEVLGVISVETRYEQYMGDTRKLLMLILVLLAPLPFIAAWIVAVYFDRRVDRFVGAIDAALDSAPGGQPDFNSVKPSWAEMDDILARFKRMAGR